MSQAAFALRGRNPDVLTCIANLSNDEVFTPPEFANQMLDGYERTSPVRYYPANGYGLFDMIGNVWEWTADWYALPRHKTAKAGNQGDCCFAPDARGGRKRKRSDMTMADTPIGCKVLKGGSHLCAENYCRRYRPAARHPQSIDSSTSHIGFRCVVREG